MNSSPPLLARVLHHLRGERSPSTEIELCTILVDGVPVRCLAGQSVASVLVGAGIWQFQRSPVSGEPRGPYCGMGVCFECEVAIDGVLARRACLTGARDGMVIRTDGSAGRAQR